MRMNFEELKPEDLSEILSGAGIVYLPLGTLEWHEKHLPFGLDALVSYELCKQACLKTGGCVIPPLYFGTDREKEVGGKIFHGIDSKLGRIMPGSLYFLNSDLFYNLLKSIAQNVAEQGFKKLIIISTHSGTAQQQVLEKIEVEKIGNLKIITLPGRKFVTGIDHAGKIETNLMLAVNPELVNLSKISKPYEWIDGEDPANSNIDEGKKQFTMIVEQIVNMVK